MKPRVLSLLIATVVLFSLPAAAWCPDNWTRDSSNPVLANAAPGTVLFHEGIYKMWYEGIGGFGYATSPDGRVWNTHGANPIVVPGLEWYDTLDVNSPTVVIVGSTYHMWYSGLAADDDSRICHATSSDGILWAKDGANPVMDLGPPGSLDSNELIHPWVVYEAPQFRMWYNGNDGTSQRIAYAVSLDGVSWARHATPSLEPGMPGEWDDYELAMMCVVPYQGSYYMWYTGFNESIELQIGYATSPDGINWQRRSPSEPVLGPGSAGTWDDTYVVAPVVLATATELVMWYGGTGVEDFEVQNFQIGVATACLPVSAPGVASVQTSRAVPNPFDSQTSIQYTLSTPSSVVLQIQDAAGRNVRRLSDGQTIAAGPHRIVWNGRDDEGNQVPAGVYFYRLEFEDFTETEKIVRVR